MYLLKKILKLNNTINIKKYIRKVGLKGRLIHSLFYKLSYSFASILFELSMQLTYGHSPTMTRH